MNVEKLADEFKLWLEQWPDGLVALDVDGIILWVSPLACTILGWKPNDLIGLRAHEILCVETRELDHDLCSCPLTNTQEMTGRSSSGMQSTYWLGNNGEFINVDYRVTAFLGAESTCFLLHFQETCQQQHNFSELEKFASFVEQNPAAIAEFDFEGQMLFGNAAMQKLLLRYGFDDVGRGIIFPHDLNRLCHQCCIEDKSVTHIEVQVGEEWYSWHFYPVADTAEKTAIGYLFDATALKRAEEEAKITQAEARRDFYAKMMHELRTPLNAIVGYSDLVLTRSAANLGERDIRALRGIKMGGIQLNELISDTLDISKIEAGRMTVDEEVFHLFEVFDAIEEQLRYLAETKRLEYVVHCDRTIEIKSDKQKVRQILLNLISNAIKYTKKGSVLVNARKSSGGDTVLMEVRDTGVGIPPEQLDSLFQAYQRVRESQNRGIQGTGLGLALVSELTAALGGEVDVQSEYGEGSTFIVALPLQC